MPRNHAVRIVTSMLHERSHVAMVARNYKTIVSRIPSQRVDIIPNNKSLSLWGLVCSEEDK